MSCLALITDLAHFSNFNAVYERQFSRVKPVRTTVRRDLVTGMLVEVTVGRNQELQYGSVRNAVGNRRSHDDLRPWISARCACRPSLERPSYLLPMVGMYRSCRASVSPIRFRA